MRRRILAAIVGTAALAVLLAGVGTYLLLVGQADRRAEATLRSEAESVAGLIDLSRNQQTGALNQKRITDGLRLEGIGVVRVRPTGTLAGTPPDGIAAAQLDEQALLDGTTISGRRRGLVWAASPVATRTGGAFVVVLTRSADRPRPPIGWFLVGGAVALGVGAAVAGALSANLTRPLRQANAATQRIAQGDLTARLPEPPPTADDEVAELARSINSMAAALEHSRGLERQFLLSVSHDLRTPLTSIRGYAEAITDGTAPVPAEAARVIGQEANRLGRLVADLLDLARLDADGFRFAPQVVPVGEVADEVGEGFRPTAESAGIELVVAASVDGTEARVDPDRLAQALANLVENGLKFASSRVAIDAGPAAGGRVELTVVDDGPGIAPGDLELIFDRLYVADRRPGRGPGGSGLGLAIVRELVVAMGGTVRATSPAFPDGSGARFTISLPAAPSPTDAPPGSPPPPPPPPAG